MDKDVAIRKLKGILSRALDNPESEEAKTAMRIAGEFMEKHGLSMEDVDEKGSKPRFVTEDVFSHIKENNCWESQLSGSVCHVFDTQVIRFPGLSEEIPYVRRFVGAPSDVELAIWYYKFLRLKVGRASELAYPTNLHKRQDYAIGMVGAIYKRLREMFLAREKAMTPQTSALMIRKREDLNDFFEDLFPNSKTVKVKKPKDRSAFFKGVKDGNTIGLSRPLEGGNSSDELDSGNGIAIVKR